MLGTPEVRKTVLGKTFRVPLSAQVVKDRAHLDSNSAVELTSVRSAQERAYGKISGEAKYGMVEASGSASYERSYDSKFRGGKKIAEKEYAKKLFTLKLTPGIAQSQLNPR